MVDDKAVSEVRQPYRVQEGERMKVGKDRKSVV